MNKQEALNRLQNMRQQASYQSTNRLNPADVRRECELDTQALHIAIEALSWQIAQHKSIMEQPNEH